MNYIDAEESRKLMDKMTAAVGEVINAVNDNTDPQDAFAHLASVLDEYYTTYDVEKGQYKTAITMTLADVMMMLRAATDRPDDVKLATALRRATILMGGMGLAMMGYEE